MATGDQIDPFTCNCPRPYTEHMPEHASWCRSLKPRPAVARDPARFETGDVLRTLTGAPLRTDAEVEAWAAKTLQMGDNVLNGQSRDSWLTVPADDWIVLLPEEQRLINEIKDGQTAGDLRRAIDRYMATVIDRLVDQVQALGVDYRRRIRK